jgi:hypothetical protein
MIGRLASIPIKALARGSVEVHPFTNPRSIDRATKGGYTVIGAE